MIIFPKLFRVFTISSFYNINAKQSHVVFVHAITETVVVLL